MSETETKLLRLVILICNRREVFFKMTTKVEFAQAVAIVAPLMSGMSDKEIRNLRKELI